MDKDFIDSLLYRAENQSLDFKRDQYAWSHADNSTKSKLLKDILAFINSWREEDAFILIGVEEGQTQLSKVVGVKEHLPDADLHQFVNSKTNHSVKFTYEAVDYESLQFGIIRIPVQERPVYSIKVFGDVKKNEVYVRRGSSCAEADPLEISRMGLERWKSQQTPQLELQIADVSTRRALGISLELECKNLYASPQVTDWLHQPLRTDIFSTLNYSFENPRYHSEMVQYLLDSAPLCPLGFTLTNQSDFLAKNVAIEITSNTDKNIFSLDAESCPVRPDRSSVPTLRSILNSNNHSLLQVTPHGDQWTHLANISGQVAFFII